ncbi:hypothetical protein GQ457_02G002990 [Hibiscus cannabinus]
MAPASPGVIQALPTAFLLSFNSKLSSSTLPCLWFLARIPVRRSLEDKPPGIIWFFLRSFGNSRSNSVFLRAKGSKKVQSKKEIWYDPLCVRKLLSFLFHHPPPSHSVRARPPLKPPFPRFFPLIGFFSWSLFCLTEFVVARRRYFPSIRAGLSRLSVADIFAEEPPVMRAGNPRIQEAISEQGALPVQFFILPKILLLTGWSMAAYFFFCRMFVLLLFLLSGATMLLLCLWLAVVYGVLLGVFLSLWFFGHVGLLLCGFVVPLSCWAFDVHSLVLI